MTPQDREETRNPELETRNQKPGTRNSKPGTRNPKPETRNPEPGTSFPILFFSASPPYLRFKLLQMLKMRDIARKIWAPGAGAAASLSFKGISELTTPEALDTADQVFHHQPALIDYFFIGIVGALGGLLVKLCWGMLKQYFPKLKKLET